MSFRRTSIQSVLEDARRDLESDFAPPPQTPRSILSRTLPSRAVPPNPHLPPLPPSPRAFTRFQHLLSSGSLSVLNILLTKSRDSSNDKRFYAEDLSRTLSQLLLGLHRRTSHKVRLASRLRDRNELADAVSELRTQQVLLVEILKNVSFESGENRRVLVEEGVVSGFVVPELKRICREVRSRMGIGKETDGSEEEEKPDSSELPLVVVDDTVVESSLMLRLLRELLGLVRNVVLLGQRDHMDEILELCSVFLAIDNETIVVNLFRVFAKLAFEVRGGKPFARIAPYCWYYLNAYPENAMLKQRIFFVMATAFYAYQDIIPVCVDYDDLETALKQLEVMGNDKFVVRFISNVVVNLDYNQIACRDPRIWLFAEWLGAQPKVNIILILKCLANLLFFGAETGNVFLSEEKRPQLIATLMSLWDQSNARLTLEIVNVVACLAKDAEVRQLLVDEQFEFLQACLEMLQRSVNPDEAILDPKSSRTQRVHRRKPESAVAILRVGVKVLGLMTNLSSSDDFRSIVDADVFNQVFVPWLRPETPPPAVAQLQQQQDSKLRRRSRHRGRGDRTEAMKREMIAEGNALVLKTLFNLNSFERLDSSTLGLLSEKVREGYFRSEISKKIIRDLLGIPSGQ